MVRTRVRTRVHPLVPSKIHRPYVCTYTALRGHAKQTDLHDRNSLHCVMLEHVRLRKELGSKFVEVQNAYHGIRHQVERPTNNRLTDFSRQFQHGVLQVDSTTGNTSHTVAVVIQGVKDHLDLMLINGNVKLFQDSLEAYHQHK